MRPAIHLLVALLLGACADPQTQCVSRANADLRAIDREIADIQTALAQGYRVTGGRTSVGFAFCTSDDPIHVCLGTETPVAERRQAIDPAAERARLRALQARRPQAAATAARAEAACAG